MLKFWRSEKNFFAASSVKKMSRFEEVSPEEIKRIVDNATPINTKRSTKYGLKIFIGKCVLNVIKYFYYSNFIHCTNSDFLIG